MPSVEEEGDVLHVELVARGQDGSSESAIAVSPPLQIDPKLVETARGRCATPD